MQLGVVFSFEILDFRDSIAIIKVTGNKIQKLFDKEAGGHRFQRVSPTEKRGRVHTSTITVAVLPEPTEFEVKINPNDLEWKTCRSSGSGGQHINKTDSAVQLKHIPSGIMIRSESSRSQHENKDIALTILRAKLLALGKKIQDDKVEQVRRDQIGAGNRNDKIRTIRLQDDIVIDHESGKKVSAKEYMKGKLELIYG